MLLSVVWAMLYARTMAAMPAISLPAKATIAMSRDVGSPAAELMNSDLFPMQLRIKRTRTQLGCQTGPTGVLAR